MIKDIVKKLNISSTLRMNEISKEIESQGKEVFKFGFGQSPFEVPEKIVSKLKNNAFQNKYLPMQGLPELRETIANYVSSRKNYNYKADNILIGPGTKELMFLLQILFDGEVILPIPSWVSYEPQAILGRNKVHWLETKREKNWFPTSEDIEKIISKNKNKNYMLFLNSPNNPSGQICENLKEISEVVRQNNILVLSDEIYSELSFENNFKSISNYCPEKTIISNGLSKWCSAGGWRLGHFVIPNELKKLKNSLKVLASETFSSVSAPIQYAAIAAYNNDHSNYLNNSRKILRLIGKYVYDGSGRFTIQLGPLEYDDYLSFLPGGHRRPFLQKVINTFTPGIHDAMLELHVDLDAAPRFQLGSPRASTLQRTAWLGGSGAGAFSITVPLDAPLPRRRERKLASTLRPMRGSAKLRGSRSISRPFTVASTISATSGPSTGAVLNDEPLVPMQTK